MDILMSDFQAGVSLQHRDFASEVDKEEESRKGSLALPEDWETFQAHHVILQTPQTQCLHLPQRLYASCARKLPVLR